jgi:hypothetical protein
MNRNDEFISLSEAIAHPDLVPIAIFSALGFVLVLNMMLHLPDLSAFLIG